MTNDELKTKVRVGAYRIGAGNTAFDDEIEMNIQAAAADLGLAGVTKTGIEDNPLVVRAIVTYCAMHRITVDSDAYERLKASYDEQKAQLGMDADHTDYSMLKR